MQEINASGKVRDPRRQGHRELIEMAAEGFNAIGAKPLANVFSDWLKETAGDPNVIYMVAQRLGDVEDMKRFDNWDSLVTHLVEVLDMREGTYERPDEWDGDKWSGFLESMEPYRNGGKCSTLIISQFVIDRCELKRIG